MRMKKSNWKQIVAYILVVLMVIGSIPPMNLHAEEIIPIENPTIEPSIAPFASATPEESELPTLEPTSEPTSEPTPAGTPVPTSSPIGTSEESVTPTPTEMPSENVGSTATPTATSDTSPTPTATSDMSPTPSVTPSGSPSGTPEFIVDDSMLNYHDMGIKIPRISESAGKDSLRRSRAVYLPSSYNAVTMGRITSVKNQNPYGTCWSFAAMNMAESSLISKGIEINGNVAKNNNIDFSERHLVYFLYNTVIDPLGNAVGDSTSIGSTGAGSCWQNGGNSEVTTFELANWVGAANEAEAPYEEILSSTLSDSLAYVDVAHMQNAYWLNLDDRDRVKEMVMEYGSAIIDYHHDNSGVYWNAATSAYYYSQDLCTNHAVSIVGWDDNFSKTNFNSANQPTGNGAWLIKNSWGTYFGDKGYFWLSYEDSSIQGGAATVFVFEPADNYDRNYFYDGSTNPSYWMDLEPDTSVANIFTAQDSDSGIEYLEAISTAFYNPNVSFNIDIYTNCTANNPTSGTHELTQSVDSLYAGYQTTKLNKAIPLEAGDKFSIVITNTGTSDASVLLDKSVDWGWITFQNTVKTGESFLRYYYSGYSWTDIINIDYLSGCTPRIKAFTNIHELMDMSTATITPVSSEEYTGAVLTPEPIVKFAGETLQNGRDYDLTYSHNTFPGTAAIEIKGKGRFKGEKTVNFTIDKRAITITAQNHTLYTGQSSENLFTVTADKLLAGDLITGCSYSCSYIAGTSTAGTYTITPSAAVIGEHTAYYSISYAPGTLTVSDILVSSIEIPDNIQLSIGDEQTISATIAPSNATKQIPDWDSSISTVATVDTLGKVKALHSGTTQIKAISKDSNAVESNICTVTVKYAIVYELNGGTNHADNPRSYYNENISLKVPTKEGYRFRGWYLDSAFTQSIYSISEQNSGDITLYAKWQETEAEEVFIDCEEVTLKTGDTFQLNGTTNPAGRTITWTSIDSEIVSVSTTGLVTANAWGTTRIVAKSGTGQAVCTVTVSPDLQEEIPIFAVSPKEATISKGTNLLLTATWDNSIITSEQLVYTFYTDDTKSMELKTTLSNGIITVLGTDDQAVMSLYNGTMTAVGLSETKSLLVSVQYQEQEASSLLTVSVPSEEIIISGLEERELAVSEKITLSADILPANRDNHDVFWISKNEEIATVDENGEVTAISQGRTQITAATTEGQTDTVDIIVSKKVEITTNILLGYGDADDNPTAILYVNGTESAGDIYAKVLQLCAKTENSGNIQAYTGNVEFTSTNPAVAIVDNDGLVTAVGEGYAVITATDANAAEGQGVFDICTVTVKKKLEQIQTNIETYDLNNAPLNKGLYLKKGMSFTVTALPIPADAGDKTLVWSTDDASVATITTKGVIKAVNVGNTRIIVKNGSGEVIRELPIYVNAATISGTVKLFSQGEPTEEGSIISDIELLAGTATNAPETNQLTGIAYTDATCSEVVPTGFTYKSSNTKVVSVDESGLVKAVAKGTAKITVTATDGSKKSASRTIKVVQPADSISLNKKILYLMPGKSGSVTATVLPSTVSDKSIIWQINDTTKFSITNKGVVTAAKDTSEGDSAIVTVTALGAAPSESVTASFEVKVISAAISRLSLNKTSVILNGQGTTEQLIVSATPATATLMNADLVWSSSNTAIADVNDGGQITVKGYGKATITVATADGSKKATCAVTTYPIDKALKISSKTPERFIQMYENDIHISTTLEIIDNKGAQIDNSLFTFTSSNVDVAVVDEHGVVTSNPAYQGSEDGKTTITATMTNDLQKRKVFFTIHVKKLLIDQSELTLYVNGDNTTSTKVSENLSAAARNVIPVWMSSNTEVATVDANGKVTARAVGTAVITATDENGSSKYANCTVTVRNRAEQIKGISKLTIQKGRSYTPVLEVLPAVTSDKSLIYSSDNTTIATIDKKGKITAKAEGYTRIRIMNTESAVTKEIEVTVVSSLVQNLTITGDVTADMNLGEQAQLTCEAWSKTKEPLLDREFVWTSSNAKIATVDENGQVTAIAKGNATITATVMDGSGKKVTRTVKVLGPVEAIQLKKSVVYLQAGKSEQLSAIITPTNADNKAVEWSINNTENFSITGTGVVKVNKAVTANTRTIVTATSRSDTSLSATCEVVVIGVPVTGVTLNATKVNLTGVGATYSLNAALKPNNCDLNETELIWTSSDENIVSVDTTGVIQTEAYGKATITAATPDGVRKATCTVTVYPIDLNYKLSALAATQNLQIYAKDTKSRCKVQVKDQFGTILGADLFSYQSSNTNILLVNNEGMVTANPALEKDGKAVITATLKGDPAKRTVKFTVNVHKTAQVEEIVLLAKNDLGTYTIAKELTQEFRKDDVLSFKAVTYNSKGESMSGKVKWTLSDTSMGKLTTNKDGSVSVTLKKDGRLTLNCQAQDKYQRTSSVAITTLTGTPKLSGSNLTINKYVTDNSYTLSSSVTIREVNGAAIVPAECEIIEIKNGKKVLAEVDRNQFTFVKNSDGTYAINGNTAYLGTLANASYTVKVNVVTDGIDLLGETSEDRHTTVFTFTLKVVNSAPTVKMGTASVNLFYTDADSRKQKLVITAPTPIDGISILPNQTNGFDEYFDVIQDASGQWYIAFVGDTSIYKKSSLAGQVAVRLKGYAPVLAKLTVSTPTTALTLKQSTTPQMDITYGNTATTAIINNTTKKIVTGYTIVSQSNPTLNVVRNADDTLQVSVAANSQVKNNSTLSTTLLLDSATDNWSKQISVKLSVKCYSTTKPSVMLGASTLTLNKQAAGECAFTTMKNGRDNLAIEDSDLWIVKRYDNATKTYVNCDDFKFNYRLSTGSVDVAFADGHDVPVGTYKLRISNMMGDYSNITKDISIKVINTPVSASISTKGTIDIINRSQKYLTATTTVKNTAAKLSGVVFTGENANDYYPVLSGDKNFIIRLRQGAVVATGKVTIPVKLTLEGGTVINSTVTFATTQNVPAIKAPVAQTIFKSGATQWAEYDLQTGIASGVSKGITIKKVTPISIPAGFGVTTDGAKVVVHLTNSNMKPGTYSIKVNSYFVGAQSLFGYPDGKPVTSTISIKVVE